MDLSFHLSFDFAFAASEPAGNTAIELRQLLLREERLRGEFEPFLTGWGSVLSDRSSRGVGLTCLEALRKPEGFVTKRW